MQLKNLKKTYLNILTLFLLIHKINKQNNQFKKNKYLNLIRIQLNSWNQHIKNLFQIKYLNLNWIQIQIKLKWTVDQLIFDDDVSRS